MNFEIFSIFQKLIKENKIGLIQDFLKENKLTTKQLSKCLTFSLINKSTSIEIIKLLIKSGANINDRNRKSRRTALLTAICYSHSIEMIDFLINSGSNLNITDSRGKSILYYIMKYMKSDALYLMNSVLERGVEINYEDRSLQNALFYAIISKQPLEILEFLIEKGANTNVSNLYGENLMHICAKYNPNIELFQLLIDKGIQINDTEQHSKTPLTYLLMEYEKNVTQIKFLVSKGASVGKSLFYFVADPKYFETIKFAFSIDSTSINEKNNLSETLLHRACLRKNNIKNIELIIQNGINLNALNPLQSTALHVACQNRLENEVIKLLISSGVDPSIKNYYGCYALEYFNKWDFYKNPDLPEIMVLLFKGIEINSRNSPQLTESSWKNLLTNIPNNKDLNSEIIKILDKFIKFPYSYSYSYSYRKASIENFLLYSYKNFELFKILFEEALKLKKTDFQTVISNISNSPLNSSAIIYILESLLQHPELNLDLNSSFLKFCSSSHEIEEFKLFLKMGVDVNYKDTYKITPLMNACKFSPSFTKISFLIESGANALETDINGNSILHHFCQSSYSYHKLIDIPELMKLFKSKGLSIHDKNNKNEDALISSCLINNVSDQLIRYLIEDGANLNSINKSGMSAFSLYLQKKNHCLGTIKFFIEKGINQENIESSFENWIKNRQIILQCHHLETFKFFFENNLLENKQKILFENSQVLHYFIDIRSITENELNDLFVLFINNGANINIETNQNETLLHLICIKYPSFIQLTKFLLGLNLDVNAVTNYKQTPLSLICKSSSQAVLIPILLSQGANPNYPQNCIDLIKRNYYFFKSHCKDLEYLFWYGAEWKNPPKSEYHYPIKINQLFLQTYKSYQEDFLNLFKRQELTDYKIQCKDGFILAHKLILTPRLYLENESEQEILQKFLNFAFQTSKTEMEIIVEFLYSGIVETSNYEEHFQFLGKFAQNLGFPKNWIIQKSGKIGLIHDLEKLYQDEKSKDFTIIFSDETTIKLHKLILVARSNLFRGMFLSVVDNSNQVHDYSEIPSKTMKSLIDFLYLDSCSSFENSEIEYFQKAKDYFQLNENCSLDLFFSQPSLANQYFNDEYLNRK
ncbi:ankyrin repeat-containing protein [Anaeramoeba ignava]|uniref:Ankyrin repeat-containing protein n=1 Tax=Anaeramoeba ignava TaxID=1746090 RepID=A0A9Q0RDE4_ANAIG|nr:ankyrin repeat-containing protein [Anaeramoeba ignava]